MTNWKIPLATISGPTPVKTPDGRTLRTLEDAAVYATGMPRSKTDKDPLWQYAVKQLMWAAEVEQPLPFTWLAVKEAIYGKTPDKPLPPRLSKQEQWKAKRKKARQR